MTSKKMNSYKGLWGKWGNPGPKKFGKRDAHRRLRSISKKLCRGN